MGLFGLFEGIALIDMDYEQFISKLKEQICHSDWHKRYFAARAKTFDSRNYWIRGILGVLGLAGGFIGTLPEWTTIGALLAGGSACIIGTILPLFKWESIVQGFEEERVSWTRIHQGYEALLRNADIADKDQLLLQQFERVEEMRKDAALKDRKLPIDRRLLNRLEKEVREYYRLD